MTVSHTPTPWVSREQGEANEFCLLTPEGNWVIAFLHNGEANVEQQRANVALIVRSVNAHDDLVKALEDARNYIGATVASAVSKKTVRNYAGCLSRIEAALAKVGVS